MLAVLGLGLVRLLLRVRLLVVGLLLYLRVLRLLLVGVLGLVLLGVLRVWVLLLGVWLLVLVLVRLWLRLLLGVGGRLGGLVWGVVLGGGGVEGLAVAVEGEVPDALGMGVDG
ncbi:hypothetical protein, partial [Streptomyces noursei]